ncbi:hypothetical protein H2200_012183 [Cladophialophora chaetospira]|uniref:Uncharacterized protein n=1 Tax=Cladophialophora chaetospira TaxID=386627 RepID=A0AA38WYC6_9EURO|nr:hypothetical protein H2200_012183 [Cladophialophora chaetospira]
MDGIYVRSSEGSGDNHQLVSPPQSVNDQHGTKYEMVDGPSERPGQPDRDHVLDESSDDDEDDLSNHCSSLSPTSKEAHAAAMKKYIQARKDAKLRSPTSNSPPRAPRTIRKATRKLGVHYEIRRVWDGRDFVDVEESTVKPIKCKLAPLIDRRKKIMGQKRALAKIRALEDGL